MQVIHYIFFCFNSLRIRFLRAFCSFLVFSISDNSYVFSQFASQMQKNKIVDVLENIHS